MRLVGIFVSMVAAAIAAVDANAESSPSDCAAMTVQQFVGGQADRVAFAIASSTPMTSSELLAVGEGLSSVRESLGSVTNLESQDLPTAGTVVGILISKLPAALGIVHSDFYYELNSGSLGLIRITISVVVPPRASCAVSAIAFDVAASDNPLASERAAILQHAYMEGIQRARSGVSSNHSIERASSSWLRYLAAADGV